MLAAITNSMLDSDSPVPHPPLSTHDRVGVRVPGGTTSITQSAQTLFKAIAPHHQLFIRNSKVTRLEMDDSNLARFTEVTPAEACSLFERYVQFFKLAVSGNLNVPIQTTINKTQAEVYLACDERRILPMVRGIMHCPILTEVKNHLHLMDGGYDSLTGLYIQPSARLPEVTLEEAVECLPGLIRDFHFQTPGDRSRALASFITPALRFGGFIKGNIPIDVAEADQSQSGKTYRQQMIAAVYRSTQAMINKGDKGVGSIDESFGTALSEGRPFIQFDNLRGSFNSATLEAFLTASGSFPVRPAYSKTIQIDPFYHLTYLSSNDFKTTVDLANRAAMVRIYKRQDYQFEDMLSFVRENQPFILALVFAVVKEWHARGKKRTTENRHSFTEWAQTLDWIVQHIFREAPLLDGHREAQNRVSSVTASFLRELALKVREGDHMGSPLSTSELADICVAGALNIPSVAAGTNAVANQLALGKILKEVFKDSEVHKSENVQITRTVETAVAQAGKPWNLKRYVFELKTS